MQSPYNYYSLSSCRIKKESPPFGGKICIGNLTTSSTIREEFRAFFCLYSVIIITISNPTSVGGKTVLLITTKEIPEIGCDYCEKGRVHLTR